MAQFTTAQLKATLHDMPCNNTPEMERIIKASGCTQSQIEVCAQNTMDGMEANYESAPENYQEFIDYDHTLQCLEEHIASEIHNYLDLF